MAVVRPGHARMVLPRPRACLPRGRVHLAGSPSSPDGRRDQQHRHRQVGRGHGGGAEESDLVLAPLRALLRPARDVFLGGKHQDEHQDKERPVPVHAQAGDWFLRPEQGRRSHEQVVVGHKQDERPDRPQPQRLPAQCRAEHRPACLHAPLPMAPHPGHLHCRPSRLPPLQGLRPLLPPPCQGCAGPAGEVQRGRGGGDRVDEDCEVVRVRGGGGAQV
mmetsp:Transcript_28997/g.93397  ORF Transcript_28997/g.93397 Transcript_28997/m.93397 type:complete len:218 (+) Transcript_28997:1037-1690(+)